MVVRSAILTKNKAGNNVIKINFPFNREDLEFVRSLPERKYNPEKKYWTTPLNIETVKKLYDEKFMLDSSLKEFVMDTKIRVENIDATTLVIPGLKGTLRPFQKVGVAFIEAKHGNALVADEMGLGKTIQALAWLQMHPEKRPAIIVVPAAVKGKWKVEALKWLESPTVQVLSGETPYPVRGDILIINYDILYYWVDTLAAISAEVLIMDEVHLVKNSQAKRSKAIKLLGRGINCKIGLTGTPIENRPIEIYNAGKLIAPAVFGSRWEFGQRFCDLKNNGWGWDFSGHSNLAELNELLTTTFMIRRLKKDVLPELPPKEYAYLPMTLDNREDYQRAENDFIGFVRQLKGDAAARRASNAVAFSKIEMMKQLTVTGKLQQAMEWITDFLNTDGKLVVFAHHKFVVERLMERFKGNVLKIDGSTPTNRRQEIAEVFQTDLSVQLMVISEAGGVGIDLFAASNIMVLELSMWSPLQLDQITDRLHRMGQLDSVTVWFPLAENSIEEKLARLLDKKRGVVDAAVDGRETEEESLLYELMKEYE
jgi:SWI/SNF-related matrix-associated actin-dependent regulator 1 of chromatin subfamily A